MASLEPLPPLSEAFRARFTGLRKLGAGGMGAVYQALDTKLRQRVAIKFMLEPTQQDASRRFAREGRMAAALDQSNMVRVLEAGADDATPHRGPSVFEQIRERQRCKKLFLAALDQLDKRKVIDS